MTTEMTPIQIVSNVWEVQASMSYEGYDDSVLGYDGRSRLDIQVMASSMERAVELVRDAYPTAVLLGATQRSSVSAVIVDPEIVVPALPTPPQQVWVLSSDISWCNDSEGGTPHGVGRMRRRRSSGGVRREGADSCQVQRDQVGRVQGGASGCADARRELARMGAA